MRQIFVFLLLTVAAFPQGGLYNDIALDSTGRPAAGATVRVCTSTATGTPCSPTQTVYSDAALSIVKTSVVADANGNFNFYATPGPMKLQITASSSTFPYLVDVPIDASNARVSKLGIANAVQSSNLLLDVGITTGASSVRFGPTGRNSGGFFTPNTTGNNLTLSAGCYFDGTNWIATETTCTQYHLGPGIVEENSDTGLVAGAIVSPTNRRVTSGSQTLIPDGGETLPTLSRLAEGGTPNTGTYFGAGPLIGMTIGGVGKVELSSTALYPKTTLGLTLGNITHSFTSVYSDTFAFRNAAGTADCTVAQRTVGLNDVFYGNANCRDVYLTGGAGRSVFLTNLLSSTAGISTSTSFTSSIATGTAPVIVSSTTPVANMQVEAHPKVYTSGNVLQTNVVQYRGSCTLGTNCNVTLTGGYSGAGAYLVFCTDTTAAAACKAVNTNGTQFVITGTGTDVINWFTTN